jgi:hypothetical protein
MPVTSRANSSGLRDFHCRLYTLFQQVPASPSTESRFCDLEPKKPLGGYSAHGGWCSDQMRSWVAMFRLKIEVFICSAVTTESETYEYVSNDAENITQPSSSLIVGLIAISISPCQSVPSTIVKLPLSRISQKIQRRL